MHWCSPLAAPAWGQMRHIEHVSSSACCGTRTPQLQLAALARPRSGPGTRLLGGCGRERACCAACRPPRWTAKTAARLPHAGMHLSALAEGCFPPPVAEQPVPACPNAHTALCSYVQAACSMLMMVFVCLEAVTQWDGAAEPGAAKETRLCCLSQRALTLNKPIAGSRTGSTTPVP